MRATESAQLPLSLEGAEGNLRATVQRVAALGLPPGTSAATTASGGMGHRMAAEVCLLGMGKRPFVCKATNPLHRRSARLCFRLGRQRWIAYPEDLETDVER